MFEVPTVLESSLLVAPALRTGKHKTHSGFGSRMGLQSVSKSNLTSNKLQYFTNSSCKIMNSTQVHSNIPEEELPNMKRFIQRRNYTLKHNSLSFKCSDSTTPQITRDSITEIEKKLSDYCEVLEGHTAGLGGYPGAITILAILHGIVCIVELYFGTMRGWKRVQIINYFQFILFAALTRTSS
ncbi:hypothetical protein OROMI_033727 [Orobanche minor]